MTGEEEMTRMQVKILIQVENNWKEWYYGDALAAAGGRTQGVTDGDLPSSD
uniref:Uncharacterized protein n=1 Tax=Physcomitrium patens TaxID=3218 RepID=A0A2K1JVQ0_PHYPA|nr:hypothetical protein PHYPA_015371 [Physcomitrium patens]